MSKKLHSGLKRTLAWMLVVALMVQGCMVVYADDFSSEPEAVVSEEISDADVDADNDLEVVEDEDTSDDVDISDDSNEDVDSDVTVEEEQADESGINEFSDGSDLGVSEDGADAVGDDGDTGAYTPGAGDEGTLPVAGNDVYEYHRYRATDGTYRFAVANYPVNGTTVNMTAGSSRQFVVKTLYATSYKTATSDVKTTDWYDNEAKGNNHPSFYPYANVKWEITEGSSLAYLQGSTSPAVTLNVYSNSTGDVKLTGTWTGYNSSDSKKYEACKLTVTYNIHITAAPDKVNFKTPFTLNGTPSSQDIVDQGVLTASDSWGAGNSYIDYEASGDGMKTCTASYTSYPSKGQGTINHNYYIDFHKMIGEDTLDTASASPITRAKLKETFRQDVNQPAKGVYIVTKGPVNLHSKSDSTNITTQAFNGGNGAVSYPSYEYEFKDASATEYSSESAVATATTLSKGSVKISALNTGTTSMRIVYTYTAKDTNVEETAVSEPIQITVSGIQIDEPSTLTLSADDATDHKIKYRLLDYTKENPDVTETETDAKLEWSIDDKSVASISTDGVLRPKKEGSATVTVKGYVNGYQNTATLSLIVTSTGGRVSLNKESLTMTKGNSQSLTATAYYNNSKVSGATFNWTTDNDKVATVDGGKITAVGYGKAVITASWTADNGTTYSGKADVNVVYDGIYFADAQKEVTLAQGSTQEIVWTVWNQGEYKSGSTGEGYNTSSAVTWKSADESVATVDSVGVVTAKNLPEGETTASTTITVNYNNKEVRKITVNVVDNQVVVSGTTSDVTGTKGETKTDKDGADKSNTWKAGYYYTTDEKGHITNNGHGSLNASFQSGRDNFDIVDGTGSTASVTGKAPSASDGYAYLSHKYYLQLDTGLCGVWEGIAVKVTGEPGLYLDKSSVTLKMGETDTASVQGTLITTDGKVWTAWANEDSYATKDLSTVNLVSGDDSIVKVETDPKNGSVCHLTAVGPGQATLTFRFDKTNYTATCDVTVVSEDARVIVSPSTLTVAEGGTGALEAKVWDGKQWVENPDVTWNTYNANTATVAKDGTVTGVKKGTVAVTAVWNKDSETKIESKRALITVVPSRNVTITTEWNDHDNQDGIRPEKATLQLTANGEPSGDPVELNAENNWTYEWKQLIAEDEEGTNIVYRVTAEDPKEYTAKVTGSADDGFVVTYSHEIAKINATANVIWDDADNQDGIRPTSVSLQLKNADGNVGDNVTVKADADGNWTKTWTDLPKYKEGKAIEYTVEETGLPDGYTVTTGKDEETGAITVKNSYTPAVKDLTVSAKWDDADDQDGARPESVEVALYAGDTATDKTVTLTAEENWTATISAMPVYKAGKAIEYTLKTTKDVEGYTSEANGTTLTFTHKAAVTSVTASVEWDDADDKDGIRPKSVSFQLKADGENVGDAIKVNAGSNWTKTWEDLPEKKAGKTLTYTVEVSDIPTEEDQYTVTTSGDAANGFVFKASHVPAAAEITAAAIWDDAENQDGVRPEKVEAELYADGEATGDKVTLNAENNWTASFGEQELKKDGKTIEYTVQVSEVENYTCDVTGSGAKGFSLKYTHKTAVVNVTVSTVWNDKENQDGNRPTSYSVQLMADGVKSGDKITLDTANDFSKTWTGLQKYRTGNIGKEIQYTVEVSGLAETYESVVSGTVADGFSVTNTYVPTSVEIPVSVTWDDAENQDGARIEAVEAELYANGEATGNKVTLNAENNWTAKFASVDVKKDGTRIKYEVKGTEADGYDVSVAGDILDEKGLVLTYKHIPAVVNVSARAAWNDANNQDGIRPTDTLVQLYADGTALGDKAVIESNKEWTKTWSDLPKYKAGKEIAYSVIAYAVSGYTVKVTGNALEGYKAEYTHNVQKMNVTVQNAWNDLDNVVDSRPAQLVVEIYANGKTTGKRVTLTEANNWKATVSGLDRNVAGKRIQYTGKAVGTPVGYNISVSTDTNGNIKLISNFTTYTKKLRLKLSKTSYVYNGKNAKPKVTVYNGRKKVSSKYYKVTYKNNKKVGYATVIVKGKGKFAKYAGKAAFTIKLKTLKKPSVKKGAKGTLNVSWKRDGQATKYVVQYSQSKKFKGKSTKTVTITNNKIGKTVLKGLTGKKNYYVRVRSCKAVNGREIWSSWSSRSSKVKVK